MCKLLSYGRNIMNFFNKFKEPSATGLCDFTWNDPQASQDSIHDMLTGLNLHNEKFPKAPSVRNKLLDSRSYRKAMKGKVYILFKMRRFEDAEIVFVEG